VINSLKEDGRVKRGWLGVRIQTVTDEIAESMGLDEASGALVASVTGGGPAQEADIQPGDVVLEFDGKKIDRMRGLPRIVAETPIAKEVDVLIWRRGEKETVKVTLGELPEDEELAALSEESGEEGPDDGGVSSAIDSLGVTVAALTDEMRARFELPGETKGVVITEVSEGSTAGEENLRPGDVIVEVGQEEVNSPPEVTAKVNQAKAEDKKSVLLLIDRKGDLRFVALRFSEG
jgi:serine protease Do